LKKKAREGGDMQRVSEEEHEARKGESRRQRREAATECTKNEIDEGDAKQVGRKGKEMLVEVLLRGGG